MRMMTKEEQVVVDAVEQAQRKESRKIRMSIRLDRSTTNLQ